MSKLRVGRASVVVAVLVLVGTPVLVSLGALGLGEDEGVEILQTVALGAGIMVFAACAVRQPDVLSRVFFASLAMLLLSFLIRELDVEDYESWPAWLRGVLSGPVKRRWQLAVWAGFLVYFAWHARAALGVLKRWLLECEGVNAIPAALLLIASWLMDAHVLWEGPRPPLVEETAELLAYALLLVSAVRSY